MSDVTVEPVVVEVDVSPTVVAVDVSPASAVAVEVVPTVVVAEVSPAAALVVEVGQQGPPGPTGPQGPPGTADLHYLHSQGVPASTWTVAHGLGKFPSVSVADSTGRRVFGGVRYLDADTVELTFSAAFSGKAYLN